MIGAIIAAAAALAVWIGCGPDEGVCTPKDECIDNTNGDPHVGSKRMTATCTEDSQDLINRMEEADYCIDEYRLNKFACKLGNDSFRSLPISRVYQCEGGCDKDLGQCKAGGASLIEEK